MYDDRPGFGGFVWAVLCLCVALYMGYVIVNTVTDRTYQDNYTERYQAYQDGQTAREQEQTRRVQAQEETRRIESEQWNATVRTWAWPTALAVILVVVAVQAGRTWRHRETEVTRRRALLDLYLTRMLPVDVHAAIGVYRGQPAIIDHDGGEIIPYDTAAAELARLRLD